MAVPRHDLIEFLRINNLDAGPYLSPDDETEPSPFDTLWTEFARSHPRLSPPRSPVLPQSQSTSTLHALYGSHAEQHNVLPPRPAIDLRALEYVTDYDTNLMCPICHVPFIDPIVLDCDHTFCGECFDTYHNSGSGSDRLRCPACRAYHLGGPRRANRLIRNMASDVRVKCPHSGCEIIMTRSSLQMHIARECPEHEMPCPVTTCTRQIKRKNYVPDTCIHNTHIECECGASIRLGRGEWIRHKDEECPNTMNTALQDDSAPEPRYGNIDACPGADYGCPCIDPISPDHPDLTTHVSTCALAKLAPFLEKQEALVKNLQRSLDQQSRRNDTLESGLDRLNEIITNSIQPRLDQITTTTIPPSTSRNSDDDPSEIEEIPRSPSSLHHHLSNHHHQQHHPSYALPDPGLTNTLQTLHDRLNTLDSQFQTSHIDTHRALRDLDARTSLALMNETLRIREELAHLNGGMYSVRAQVAYLVNQSRIAGQRDVLSSGSGGGGSGIAASLARGFSSGVGGSGGVGTSGSSNTAGGHPSSSSSSNFNSTGSQDQSQSQPQSYSHFNLQTTTTPIPMSNPSAGSSGSRTGSTSTSPNLNSNNLFNTTHTRPNLRRGSGGSASGSRSSIDRVKL